MSRPQEIEHTADRAFRVEGRNTRELFENAAKALFCAQSKARSGPVRVSREFTAIGVDSETLLVNCLNELLFFQEKFRETYDRFQVINISDTEIRAKVSGRTGSSRVPVKAVTFHYLKIEQVKNRLRATFVMDV